MTFTGRLWRSRRTGWMMILAIMAGLWGCAARGAAPDGGPPVKDVIYGRKFGMALTMDVLRPATPNGIGVVFMVSGGWASDPGMINPLGFNPDWFKAFTDRGQTVFLVSHGSQPKFQLAEILPDIARAVRFIHVHATEYGVDPNRLGASGASSGGHLSLMAGATGKPGDPTAKDPVSRASSEVEAVACFYPPTDLVDYGKPGQTFLEYGPVKVFSPVFGLEGKPRDEQIPVLRSFSPYSAVTVHMPPTLILQGDQDPLVPREQADRFMAKLEELKVPHRLVIHPGGGHGWANLGSDFVLLAEWYDKYLAKKP